MCPVGGGTRPQNWPSHPILTPQQSRDEERPYHILSSSSIHLQNTLEGLQWGHSSRASVSLSSQGWLSPTLRHESYPDSPRGDSSVENSSPHSSCFPLLFQCTGSAFPEGKKKLDPASPELRLGAEPSWGMESRSQSPCLPSQHRKSRGMLCFQETAAPPAKKHELEQSPTIFGLEMVLSQSPKRHHGGCVTLGLSTSHSELSFNPPKAPQIQGMSVGMTPSGLRWLIQLLAWMRHRREFLRRGFQRFSINFCTNPGTIPPLLLA